MTFVAASSGVATIVVGVGCGVVLAGTIVSGVLVTVSESEGVA